MDPEQPMDVEEQPDDLAASETSESEATLTRHRKYGLKTVAEIEAEMQKLKGPRSARLQLIAKRYKLDQKMKTALRKSAKYTKVTVEQEIQPEIASSSIAPVYIQPNCQPLAGYQTQRIQQQPEAIWIK